MDIRDYLKIIKKRWRQSVAVVLLLIVFYGVSILGKATLYTAFSTVMLRDPTLEEQIASSFSTLTTQGFVSPENQISLMRSRQMAENVARAACEEMKKEHPELLGGKTPVFRCIEGKKGASILADAALVDEVMKAVSISQIGATNMLKITVISPVQEKSVAFAKHMAQIAKKQNKDYAIKEHQSAQKYLETKMKEYSDRFDKADGKIRELNRQFGIFDFEMETADRLNKLSEHEAEMEQIAFQKNEVSRFLNDVQSRLAAESKFTDEDDMIPNPLMEQYQAQLLPLEKQLLEYKEFYTDVHPKIVMLRKQMDALKKKIRQEVPKYVAVPKRTANPDYQIFKQQAIEQELNLSGLQTREIALERVLQKEQGFLKQLSGKERQYADVIREKNTAERLYRSMYDMLEQMRVREILKPGNLEIVDLPAAKPSKVSKIQPMSVIFILLMSMLVSVGVITILELVDDSIQTTFDVKRYLNLEAVGVVPVFREPEKFILDLSPTAPSPEVYNRIAFHLQSLCLDHKIKTIVITSPLKGDGKTLISSNVGIALAGTGENVVLVDADIRNPTLHRLFRLPNTYGLTSYLSGELHAEAELQQLKEGKKSEDRQPPAERGMVESIIQRTNKEGVSVLTSGNIVSNPVELLTSARLKELVQAHLKQMYSKVIIDTPPLLATIDPAILSSLCDGIVLVVNASSNHRKDVIMAKKTLQPLKIKILGVVLNQVGVEEEMYYSYYVSGYGAKQRA